MIPPDAFDTAPAPVQTVCAHCDGRLSAGRRFVCAACELAARVAIERAGGQVVRPSDIEKVRGEQ